MTGLDFPGLVSAVVFTRGCNFHCPYCHNAHLISRREEAQDLSLETVSAFLKKRSGLLDGLVISGGEPTLQTGLVDFCRSARELGYKIKLDTNGSDPERVAALLEEGLLDYIALDCKALPDRYFPNLCRDRDIAPKFLQTLRYLRQSGLPYEVRTTCVEPHVMFSDIEGLAALSGSAPWFLQKAKLTDSMRANGLREVTGVELEKWRARAAAAGALVYIR